MRCEQQLARCGGQCSIPHCTTALRLTAGFELGGLRCSGDCCPETTGGERQRASRCDSEPVSGEHQRALYRGSEPTSGQRERALRGETQHVWRRPCVGLDW